jgi:hypothetical protein
LICTATLRGKGDCRSIGGEGTSLKMVKMVGVTFSFLVESVKGGGREKFVEGERALLHAGVCPLSGEEGDGGHAW